MDCGPGTAGRIALHVPVKQLDAVVISHLHPDHYFDLVALYYLQKYGEPRIDGRAPRLPVWVPPGGRRFLDKLGRLIAGREAMLEDVFDLNEYSAKNGTPIGSLAFTFHPVQHYVPSHAIRMTADGGATLVFSSDVAPCPQIVDAARGADLFLCETALLDASQDDPRHRGHLSAAEAGAVAREAAVRRLLLTHYRSGEKYEAHHLKQAGKTFEGPVELAREGETYVVGSVAALGF
jgi:ribonuclease BN (tRNA processing enzyme)